MISRYFERSDRYNIVLDVSPSLADDVLTNYNPHNRRLVDAHANRLAGEIKAGRWRLTHQGIAFSVDRVLLDGQHRLWAVILAEQTVPMRVFFNEPRESLHVVDAIRARTNDEILTLGGGLGIVTRSELSTLRAMLAGLGNYVRMTPGEEAVYLARHREAITFAHDILPSARFRGVGNAVTRAVLARAFYSADHDQLRHFADVLQTGVPTRPEDGPISLLFRFLIESVQSRRGRPEVRERYAKTERALTAYLAGEALGRLYATATELFPLESPRSAMPA